MKPNEEKIRQLIEEGLPFILITGSGDRVKVKGRDWIFLQPLESSSEERTDFFQVWGNGKSYRWIAFASISMIETVAP